MLDLLLTFMVIVFGLVGIPILVYVSAKMGSYGWLKGKHLFWEDHRSNRKGKYCGDKTRA